MMRRTVKRAHSRRNVDPAGRRPQRRLWFYAIAAIAAFTAAGAEVWSVHAQDSQGQDSAEIYISLPEGPSTFPSYPVTKQPEVILESTKPAATPPAIPVVQKAALSVAPVSAPLQPPADAIPTKPVDEALRERGAESVLPADQDKEDVASEAADLLKMATALKAEVDKTTKDTLSLTVVRKAGEIEQLAHKVRLGTGKG
jgi:hypothetical protein